MAILSFKSFARLMPLAILLAPGALHADGMVGAVSDSNFQYVILRTATPVLVEFGAEWCGPCKQMAPILDGIAKEYAGKVKIVKLNIDANSNTAAKYGVRGIPTFILFKGGKIVGTKVGVLPRTDLEKLLNP